MRVQALLVLGLLAMRSYGAEWRSLSIEPRDISLSGPGAAQRYVVTATDANGVDHDVTTMAVASSSRPDVAGVASRTISGKAGGQAEVRVRLGTLSAMTRVSVGKERADLSVAFSPDVISILTTKGCNSSNCHGAIAGKSGFKLSLFGYDIEADHKMILPRVRVDQPQESLFLRKPSFVVAHGGGKVLPAGSNEYQTVLTWLKQGARLDSTGPRIVRLEMYPQERTVMVNTPDLGVVVMARLSDGTTRDMTGEVRYETSDESIAKLGVAGLLKAGTPGLATILARAMGKAATTQVGVIGEASGGGSTAANNFIDDLVFGKLRRMNLRPSALSTDNEFLRRVYIDAIGRVPKVEERRKFLASPNRTALIDELLDHPEFVSYRTLKFEDWFRNTQLYSQGRPMGSFKYWVKDQVAVDRPYDLMVKDLLTSLGDTNRNPAGGFWFPATDFMLNKFDVKMITPTVTRLFLGVRMECAECHNHPLENFTQDDFYGLAAFFGKMRVKIGAGVYRRTWYLDDQAEVEHPATKKAVMPKLLGEPAPEIPAQIDRRQVLADWITSPNNPYFARATVNRIWHDFFGTGIVEPFDDMRSTNMPSNKELLDRLADHFVKHGFRMKPLFRAIFNSRTYQLSSVPAEGEQPEQLSRLLFARYYPRKLPAEVLLDSIAQVSGVAQKHGGHPAGTLAKDLEINDGPSYFMAVFGFPRRDVLSDRNESPTLAQALHLMNRGTLKDKLEPETNVIGTLLGRGAGDDEIITEIYERAYSRQPSAREMNLLREHFMAEQQAGRTRRRALENVLLVVLNSKEFQLNH